VQRADLRTSVSERQDISVRCGKERALARAMIATAQIKSPAEPGCRVFLFSMQNYFASFAI
jgi:hypothetical protein